MCVASKINILCRVRHYDAYRLRVKYFSIKDLNLDVISFIDYSRSDSPSLHQKIEFISRRNCDKNDHSSSTTANRIQ